MNKKAAYKLCKSILGAGAVFTAATLFVVLVANAQTLPGASCENSGEIRHSGGPEVTGGGHLLVCNGSIWKSLLSFNRSAQLTALGNQGCTPGQLLKFDGTIWSCADDEAQPIPRSCYEILINGRSTGNGLYDVSLDGLTSSSVYCDMSTEGGGWTIVHGNASGNGGQGLISNTVVNGNPLSFAEYNMNRAQKISLAAFAGETIFVRNNGIWLKMDKPFIDANVNTPNQHPHNNVTLSTNDGTTANAVMGYSNYNNSAGGEFGITTTAGFTHVNSTHYHLNGSCAPMYLYNYGAGNFGVNLALGAWTVTNACSANNTVAFYTALREDITPENFDIADTVTLDANVVRTSDIVQITGLGPDVPVPVSLAANNGQEYRICSNATCSDNPPWRTRKSFVTNNQYIQLRGTTPAVMPNAYVATLSIGLTTDKWALGYFAKSCYDILYSGFSTGNGVYTIDPDGPSGPDEPFEAYCDMTTNGGGWTMVTAQFEADQMTNWGEGLQLDYNPTLATSRSFSFSPTQLPPNGQVAFGQQLDPTFVDYVDFKYTHGDIAPTVHAKGNKTGDNYQIHRHTANLYLNNDPEAYNTVHADWNNTLTFDKISGSSASGDYSWAFSPNNTVAVQRGYGMNGVGRWTDADTLAWTVWVRDGAVQFADAQTSSTNTLVTSAIMPVDTISTASADISITGQGSPQYRICDDATCSTNPAWTGSAGTVSYGQYLQLRLTSASTPMIRTASLTIGPGTTKWNVTMPLASCSDYIYQNPTAPSGVYQIDPDGTGGNAPFNAYCNMTAAGGGWTMVVAQFGYPDSSASACCEMARTGWPNATVGRTNNWNEGIQGDYNPSFATKAAFTLSTAQIPTHTQTAFGRDLDPTFIDYFDFNYTTGNIPRTNLAALKNVGSTYQIYRNTANSYTNGDPELGLSNDGNWLNALMLDRTGGTHWDWVYAPNQGQMHYSGMGMNGWVGNNSNQKHIYSVWVRNYDVDPDLDLVNVIAAPNTLATSDITLITGMVGGLSVPVTMSGSDGSPAYRICTDDTCSTNPAWTTAPGTTRSGEYIQVRLTTPATPNQSRSVSLTVGGTTEVWSAGSTGGSCYDLLLDGVTSSGMYYVDADGPGGVEPFDAYCDMTNKNGGWMLVMNTTQDIANVESTAGIDYNDDSRGVSDTRWAGLREWAERLYVAQDPAIGSFSAVADLDKARSSSYANCNTLATSLVHAARIIHAENSGCDGSGVDYCVLSQTFGSKYCASNISFWEEIDGLAFWNKTRIYVREDIHPNDIVFNTTHTTNLSTMFTSSVQQVTDIAKPVRIAIEGSNAEYRICADGACAANPAWTSAPGLVANNDYIQVRMMSPSFAGLENRATITVGGSNFNMSILTGYRSCQDRFNTGTILSGNYQIDGDGPGPNPAETVACSMWEVGKTGWTRVAWPTENNTTNWNGTNALSEARMAPHSKIGFSRNTEAPESAIGYAHNYAYTTGNIPKTSLLNQRDGLLYHIYRNSGNYYNYHDPDDGVPVTADANWFNTLTFDMAEGRNHNWAFSPNFPTASYRGYAYQGARYNTLESSGNQVWAVWVGGMPVGPHSLDYGATTDAGATTASPVMPITGLTATVGQTQPQAAVTVSGAGTPQYRICNDNACTSAGAWTSASTTINNGQYLQLRTTAGSGARNVIIKVGTVTGIWRVVP